MGQMKKDKKFDGDEDRSYNSKSRQNKEKRPRRKISGGNLHVYLELHDIAENLTPCRVQSKLGGRNSDKWVSFPSKK